MLLKRGLLVTFFILLIGLRYIVTETFIILTPEIESERVYIFASAILVPLSLGIGVFINNKFNIEFFERKSISIIFALLTLALMILSLKQPVVSNIIYFKSGYEYSSTCNQNLKNFYYIYLYLFTVIFFFRSLKSKFIWIVMGGSFCHYLVTLKMVC